MLKLTDTSSLAEFRQNAVELVARLKETRRPRVLTIGGRAEVVVLDLQTYGRLLDLVDRAEAITGIREGLESAARGEGRPIDEAITELRAKYGGASVE